VKWTLYLEMVLLLLCRTFPFAQTIPPSPEQNPESLAPFGIAVLSDTLGVDLGPYVRLVQKNVTYTGYNWYKFNAQPARGIQGKASIEFAITKDGKIAGMKMIASSGDFALDHDIWRAVSASQPFPPLPKEFGGQFVALRLRYEKSGIVVNIWPHNSSIRTSLGASSVFVATVTGTTNTSVIWRVTGTGCSGTTCGTILEGLYTAPSVLPSLPSVTVTATSQEGPAASASVTVDLVSTVGMTISPTSAKVVSGAKQQFSATVTGTTNISVNWSVLGPGCERVACGIISADGLYTAPLSIPNPPTVAVTATLAGDSGKVGSAVVAIEQAPTDF
jgi:TonB family protein